MRLYIYTIPKAGTYLLADFAARLGLANTGLHVNRDRVLNTLKFDLDTNARFPSRAMERQTFLKTLREQPDASLSFGHFPAPMMANLFPEFHFLCAYRHPRKTLVSEFVDFRFRRQDIQWISPLAIADDAEAFTAFLDRQGPAHMAIFGQMLGLTLLYNEPLCTAYDERRIHFVSFDAFLASPGPAAQVAGFLQANPALARPAWEAALAAETKTKATDLELDRQGLWTKGAEQAYAKLQAEAYAARARSLGWEI